MTLGNYLKHCTLFIFQRPGSAPPVAGKIAVDVHVTLRKVVFCICKINYLTAKSMTFNQPAAGATGPEVRGAGAATGPGGSSRGSRSTAQRPPAAGRRNYRLPRQSPSKLPSQGSQLTSGSKTASKFNKGLARTGANRLQLTPGHPPCLERSQRARGGISAARLHQARPEKP